MKFGPVALDAAEGAILAHSVACDGRVFRKGLRLGRADLDVLAAAGIGMVVAARLEEDDVHEDAAAARLALAVAGPVVTVAAPFTGRANILAEAAGVLVVDRGGIDAFNRIDPAMTLATLPEFARVATGEMVATVKIIPFAVGAASLASAEALSAGGAFVRVAPFRLRNVGHVSTVLPSLKPSVLDKTRRVTQSRLKGTGASLQPEMRVPHDEHAVASAISASIAAGAELVIVFGASAMVDPGDVIPAAIRAAGGQVIRFGMPVDPGNLLVLGAVGDIPVIGAPGCARSSRANGFDFVLSRLLAGLPVDDTAVAGMGVGGLLGEIRARPEPRDRRGGEAQGGVAAILLAAGMGRRMGGPDKLLAEIGGVSLVRRVAMSALASRATPIMVVTGHRAEAVGAALAGLAVTTLHNPEHAAGLSTSLRLGITALDPAVDGALILLADMPFVSAATIDRLIAEFEALDSAAIIVPVHEGRRGNPVLWPRRYFAELAAIEGDVGARDLLKRHAAAVVDVPAGREITEDIDTPDALAAAGGRLPG